MESRMKANITILKYHETWKFPFSFIPILTRKPVITILVNSSAKPLICIILTITQGVSLSDPNTTKIKRGFRKIKKTISVSKFSLSKYDLILFHLCFFSFGLVWSGLVWFGLVWSGLV